MQPGRASLSDFVRTDLSREGGTGCSAGWAALCERACPVRAAQVALQARLFCAGPGFSGGKPLRTGWSPAAGACTTQLSLAPTLVQRGWALLPALVQLGWVCSLTVCERACPVRAVRIAPRTGLFCAGPGFSGGKPLRTGRSPAAGPASGREPGGLICYTHCTCLTGCR